MTVGQSYYYPMRLVDKLWFNALWFQVTWFCCVLGREDWLPVALLSLGLHFWLVEDMRLEFMRLMPVALIGIGTDIALTLAGVFEFNSKTIVPVWLVVLWWVFGAALYRSLSKVGRSLWLASLLGGVAVPFNYMLGARLGAVSLPLSEVLTTAVLVAVWATLLPILYLVSHRLDAKP